MSARAAERGGADRIELCGPLDSGGTTPSSGLIEAVCRAVAIPVHVLIRARAGDFCYSVDELQVMALDSRRAQELGAAGVVIGALDAHGQVDRSGVDALIKAARPLSVAFHRAIDAAADPLGILDALIELGIDRVLTSGGQPTALAGAKTIAALVKRAQGRIAILAGSGVSADTAATIVATTGVVELHVGSAVRRSAAVSADSAFVGQFGQQPVEVDAELVAELVRRLR
jgi:copper homeostasis protein